MLLNVSMDFMLGIPFTQRAINSIFIFVDRFLKMTHFITCQKIIVASWVAHIYFNKVVHLYGIHV